MLFVAGLNNYNQLFTETKKNNPDKIPCLDTFTHISLDPSNIADFSLGGTFSAYITKDGQAFGIGDDTNFCLGTSKRQVYKTPVQIQFSQIDPNDKFVSVHCGSYYTAYLTESGLIIYCSYYTQDFVPVIHRLPAKAIYLSGGILKPVAIDENGDFYLFKENPVKEPKQYHLDEPVYDIIGCDNVFSSGFTIVITVSGKIYSNGSFSEENPTFAIVPELSQIDCQRVFGIHRHCIAITRKNQVNFMGSNSSGQFGNGDSKCEARTDFERMSIFDSYKILTAAAGYGHTLYLTSNGKLLGCGNCEYGQCGIGSFENSNILCDLHLPVEKAPTHVWAGPFSSALLFDAEAPKHRGIELILKKFQPQ